MQAKHGGNAVEDANEMAQGQPHIIHFSCTYSLDQGVSRFQSDDRPTGCTNGILHGDICSHASAPGTLLVSSIFLYIVLPTRTTMHAAHFKRWGLVNAYPADILLVECAVM